MVNYNYLFYDSINPDHKQMLSFLIHSNFPRRAPSRMSFGPFASQTSQLDAVWPQLSPHLIDLSCSFLDLVENFKRTL